MAKGPSYGRCNLCGKAFSKAGMTRHLNQCRQVNLFLEKDPSLRQVRLFHLVVEGRDLPAYWLHLAAPADATLQDLDRFLRDIWLECCGHLSAFIIQGVHYDADPRPAGWFIGDNNSQDMATTLASVLRPGSRFDYEYDLGMTTKLTGRVVAAWEGPVEGKSIQAMARNAPPPLTCVLCGQPATEICSKCMWSDAGGTLCEACSQTHACGEDMLLPVVNSPRMGMCAYVG